MTLLQPVTLADKYEATEGRVYLTGSQALVRLPIDQARRDAAAGLNTAGFISGYRGSPLGGYDSALWQAGKALDAHRIHFEPGVNEDLAAAAVWGSQQVPLLKGARYDGVFGVWYGKGPGVDRSADVLKHGNFAGTSRHGGVLALAGDDHAARSSTVAHQSDHAFVHCGMPVLNPADIQDYLTLGLHGFALSRFSACWVGFKCVTDVVDGSASVLLDGPDSLPILPDDYAPPPGGLWIRAEIAALAQEARLFEERHRAVHAYVRANRLDHMLVGGTGRKRLGIVTTGKNVGDVSEALRRMDVDPEAMGIAVYKVAMVWPLEPDGIRAFAAQCDELLVIEEKRGLIEEQLAHILYNLPADQRPRLLGKRDESGRPLVSEVGELGPDAAMRAIASRLPQLAERAEAVLAANAVQGRTQPIAIRPPAFCAGCPHSTSTHVPEGSIAVAGIGCHGMASLMPERNTMPGSHMGGEGAPWIGQSPFTDTGHIFQNIGDGTYFHSGLLAIRACVAANVNITYKVLLNGAVGMTGGQPIEGEEFAGEITAPRVAHQVSSEGVNRIAVVSDDADRFSGLRGQFPAGTSFHHRDDLDAVQRELTRWKGVSVLIYDQSCATERRRLRKRGKVAQATERLLIASEVCEGCGDCGAQSGCIAIEPLPTPMGTKRAINQSTCNQDYSCLKGFCPSFITLTGGKVKANAGSDRPYQAMAAALPEPSVPAVGDGSSLLVTGIGGAGVVTIGAILGMASHIEGKGISVLDMSGFAQRNGSVMSHVRFLPAGERSHTARIPVGGAAVVVGCDPVVTAGAEALGLMAPGKAQIVLNDYVAPTSAFAGNPDFSIDTGLLRRRIGDRAGEGHVAGVAATPIATALLGDAIGANMLLVGFAWQRGLIPVERAAIEQAIRLNGVAVQMNLDAFMLGRLLADKPERASEWMSPAHSRPTTLEDILAVNMERLTGYQDAALAERYRARIAALDEAERALGKQGLATTAADVYARLLAIKDEYEVARLLTGDVLKAQIENGFEGDVKLSFNLAPPLLAKRDPATGRLKKMEFGAWMLPVFRLLAALKGLRGTAFDMFGWGAHRRLERDLIAEYEALMDTVLAGLSADNHAAAVELLAVHGGIRGYDVVKEASIEKARAALPKAKEAFEKGGHQPSGERALTAA